MYSKVKDDGCGKCVTCIFNRLLNAQEAIEKADVAFMAKVVSDSICGSYKIDYPKSDDPVFMIGILAGFALMIDGMNIANINTKKIGVIQGAFETALEISSKGPEAQRMKAEIMEQLSPVLDELTIPKTIH